MRLVTRLFVFGTLLLCSAQLQAEDAVRVLGAASLTSALNDISAQWQKQNHPAPSMAYGASSALARQIEAGAPADIFASADLSWMDYLKDRKKIENDSVVNLLGNDLVLIVPKGKRFPIEFKKDFKIVDAFKGKLCTGEPGVVPVGIYARQSLEQLGWWSQLSGRIVGTDDVRTALAFVERGECPLGIVYASDAAISSKVEVLKRFPDATHKPIVYPFALVSGARPEAKALMTYMSTSAEAAAIFKQYGFVLLKP